MVKTKGRLRQDISAGLHKKKQVMEGLTSDRTNRLQCRRVSAVEGYRDRLPGDSQ